MRSAWMDLKGFAGLRFRNMRDTQEQLEGWLAQQALRNAGIKSKPLS